MAALWKTDTIIETHCDFSNCMTLGCGFTSKNCSCEAGCESGGVKCCSDFAKVGGAASSLASVRQHHVVSCKELQVMLPTANVIMIVVLVIFLAPGAGLSTYAWYYGMKLWSRLTAGEQLMAS